jgi:hypothetical protein
VIGEPRAVDRLLEIAIAAGWSTEGEGMTSKRLMVVICAVSNRDEKCRWRGSNNTVLVVRHYR